MVVISLFKHSRQYCRNYGYCFRSFKVVIQLLYMLRSYIFQSFFSVNFFYVFFICGNISENRRLFYAVSFILIYPYSEPRINRYISFFCIRSVSNLIFQIRHSFLHFFNIMVIQAVFFAFILKSCHIPTVRTLSNPLGQPF